MVNKIIIVIVANNLAMRCTRNINSWPQSRYDAEILIIDINTVSGQLDKVSGGKAT